MKQKILILFLIMSISIYGQKRNSIDLIKLNTKFTLEMETKDSLNYNFKIVSQEPFNQEIEWSESHKYLDSILKKNQIQGILSKGNFGKNENTILIIKSGVSKSLSYKLKIKIPNKRKLINTSVVNLYHNIPSTELWSYEIEYIKFSNFKVDNPIYQYIIEPEIDSTCIKNANLNLENGKKIFLEHLDLTTKGFEQSNNFELNSLLDYEKHLSSEDVSLGHYYSLGKGIYPNEQKFKFGNPISYRRLECPIFDEKVSYFYTKDKKYIKVISYEWSQFKKSNWSLKEEIDSKKIRNEFEKKYIDIKNKVISKLGEPVNIRQEKDSGRIDTKWKNNNGIKAYLFMFEKSNRIRLYIYKE